jgi:hypothetical protein
MAEAFQTFCFGGRVIIIETFERTVRRWSATGRDDMSIGALKVHVETHAAPRSAIITISLASSSPGMPRRPRGARNTAGSMSGRQILRRDQLAPLVRAAFRIKWPVH